MKITNNEIIKRKNKMKKINNIYIDKKGKYAYSFVGKGGDQYALRKRQIDIYKIFDTTSFENTQDISYLTHIKTTGFIAPDDAKMEDCVKAMKIYNFLYKKFTKETKVSELIKEFGNKLSSNIIGEYAFMFEEMVENKKRFEFLKKWTAIKY